MSHQVPLLDLKAQYASIRDEVLEAMDRVIESQSFIMGPEVKAFEDEIASYTSARYAVGCASGSDALLLALMAVGVGPGDEVICPAYTFFATGSSVARLGARPIYVDIDPRTYNMDPDCARSAAAHCKRLRAIMPVHLFGQAADMAAYAALAEELGVPLIEDAAQALGARDSDGVPVGTRGALACFSFFPSKNLGAFGDAGLVTSNDAALADRVALLHLHGGRPKYYHKVIGINSRLDALQAAVLRVKLRHLDNWTKDRQQHAAYYDDAFAAAGARASGVSFSAGELPLRTPAPAPAPSRHVYNQYVIRVLGGLRDALRERLSQVGIGTEIYYPVGLHLQECFAYLGGRAGDLPETESAARETLALPVYPELTRKQLDAVVREVVDFVRSAGGRAKHE